VQVPCCEAQEAHSCVEQSVLTAIVFSEAVSMKPAVVLDSESVTLVVEIRTADEPAPPIVNGDLYLGSREAAEDQQHP